MKKIRLLFLKIAYLSLNGLRSFGHVFGKILPYFTKPFRFVFKRAFRYLFLPFYKIHLFIKRKILNFYSPAKSKVFLFLTKKYIVHALVVVLAFCIVWGNVNVKETRAEGFGEKTIIYSMFNDQRQYEMVEETAVYEPQEKILSYLDKSSQIENQKLVQDAAQINESQLAEGLTTITEGGAAVVKPNITETEFTTASRNKIITHTVDDGETISTIAERYGISTNTVLWANNLGANSVIKPGAQLKILPVSGITHSVKSGDTLKSIANKYDADEAKIIEFNNLSEDGSLVAGDELILPGGSKPVTYTTTTYVSRPTTSIKDIISSPSQSTISTVVKGSSVGYGSMVWPTSWRVITQYYNWRHTGLDIDGDYNSPIYSAEAGTVIWAGWKNGYGNTYIVDHGNGVTTLYAHLSKYFAKQGQYVARGETLGMMGTTGWSTGTHLHFEVRINGVKQNPLSYIR